MPTRDQTHPPAADTSAIEVAHLSHTYPGAQARVALDDVSFTVQPGEIFGILGPNGGGKTTLFRILATLLTPRSPDRAPTARIFGHDVTQDPASVRQMLGVVFQQPSLDGKLTARENLAHQGRLHGLGGKDLHARIDHWLTRFGLTDRADEYTERFSGGMRRRVELAKAMLHEPRLLLMDEPATGLDPGARHELWQQLARLRSEQGITVALTTHLMEEADRCDRLAILSRGRLVAMDTPARLKAQVGGDVVTIELAPSSTSDAADELAQRIAEQFGPWDERTRPQVVDGHVRFEKPDATAMVTPLANLAPEAIRRITVGQPTLEDVFLDLTGAAFHEQAR